MNAIERYESASQSLVRSAPIVFQRALGAELFDEDGGRYIDFCSGGGTLGYGHNHLKVCSALIDYLCQDHVLQTRDKSSVAKRAFIEAFVGTILAPRGLNYKLLFTDPASGSAAEMAIRIARRDRKRNNVVVFTHATHGLTDNAPAARSAQPGIVVMPYCNYLGPDSDTIPYLRRTFEDLAGSSENPAALIVAAAQADHAVEVAGTNWLQALAQLCREFKILLIADETLAGCGRIGPFFGFERAGITPDMVIVSHALAGGLPLSLLLLRPELDRGRHGDQAGLFQGDSLALVAATELLALWKDDSLTQNVARHEKTIGSALDRLVDSAPERGLSASGTGMLWSLELRRPASGSVVASWALEQGLVIEPAPRRDDVLLILPPITIGETALQEGLGLLTRAVATFLKHP